MMELLCSMALFAMSFDDFVARCWLAVVALFVYLLFTTAR